MSNCNFLCSESWWKNEGQNMDVVCGPVLHFTQATRGLFTAVCWHPWWAVSCCPFSFISGGLRRPHAVNRFLPHKPKREWEDFEERLSQNSEIKSIYKECECLMEVQEKKGRAAGSPCDWLKTSGSFSKKADQRWNTYRTPFGFPLWAAQTWCGEVNCERWKT